MHPPGSPWEHKTPQLRLPTTLQAAWPLITKDPFRNTHPHRFWFPGFPPFCKSRSKAGTLLALRVLDPGSVQGAEPYRSWVPTGASITPSLWLSRSPSFYGHLLVWPFPTFASFLLGIITWFSGFRPLDCPGPCEITLGKDRSFPRASTPHACPLPIPLQFL